jgi:hypothetical protein
MVSGTWLSSLEGERRAGDERSSLALYFSPCKTAPTADACYDKP